MDGRPQLLFSFKQKTKNTNYTINWTSDFSHNLPLNQELLVIFKDVGSDHVATTRSTDEYKWKEAGSDLHAVHICLRHKNVECDVI